MKSQVQLHVKNKNRYYFVLDLSFHLQNFPYNPLKTELTLPHYILEEPIFDFRYVRLCDVNIPKENNG